jgi:acetoin utilization deacetylase AcuC-like enzyme
LNRCNLKKVAIIDFDVHHGNGTQEILYENHRILYISLHQYPHYPGTGVVEEVGRGAGYGANVNIPLPPGSGDGEYLLVFNDIIAPIVRRFEPELILVSAGYDGHWSDPLAMMRLTIDGYARMVGIIKKIAEEICQGRMVLTLEGGYALEVLAASVATTFDVMLGQKYTDPFGNAPSEFGAPDISNLVTMIKDIHRID